MKFSGSPRRFGENSAIVASRASISANPSRSLME